MRFFCPLKTSSGFRSIAQHRAIISSKRSSIAPACVEYRDVPINLQETPLLIRVYSPRIGSPPYPTIFFIPGTAFIANETGGDASFSHVFCSHLAEKTGYQVIKLCHRLAPEHQFPSAYIDTYRLFHYFAKTHPDKFKIDTKNIIISGYSSGGNLAALVALKATKAIVTRQILISPMVDLSRIGKGFEEFENKDTFPEHREFVKWMIELYLPEKISPKNPAISPYWTSLDKLNALPPTDIIFGEFDLVRGDCERYKEKLIASLVDVNGSFMFSQGDHSLLWKRPIDIATLICNRIQPTVDRPISHNDCACNFTFFIATAKRDLKTISAKEAEKPDERSDTVLRIAAP